MQNPLKCITLLLFVFTISSCTKKDVDFESKETIEFTGHIESFSDFFVAKLLNDENLHIALTIIGSGRDDLNLSASTSEFTLPNNKLDIEISKWDRSVRNHFSNDAITVGEEPVKVEKWTSISGKVTISISDVNTETEAPNETTYRISIELKYVVFENEEGEQKVIEKLNIKNAFVGWLPG
ncbi:MAG: hypothetical protein ACI9U0_001834 [Flavobacteriales bacterium]|jgi:hypothetical protein|tara:strand:- start:678 stop:1220 length:543 start_codon:yes stop_codon:yes gene_type:complete